MKRYWKFLFVILSLFLIVGCKNNQPKEEQPKQPEPEQHTDVEPEQKNTDLDILKEAAKQIVLPLETKEDIELIEYVVVDEIFVNIEWTVYNMSSMRYNGKVVRSNNDKAVHLKATFFINSKNKYEKEYDVVVLGYSVDERLELAANEIKIDSYLNMGSIIPTSVSDSDVILNWISDKPEIVDEKGVKSLPSKKTTVTLTCELTLFNKTKLISFEVTAFNSDEVLKMSDQTIINKYEDFEKGTLTNLKFDDNKCLVMTANAGTYLSPIFNTGEFSDLVGSWCAITNASTGSVELQVRVKVGDTWSAYMSYGAWKLSAKNASKSGTTTDGLAKMDSDTVVILNKKKANAFQYKVLFNKTSEEVSPILKNIVINIDLGLKDVEILTSKQNVLYDVPKLYQHDVPSIGGSICSPTTTTMMLKFYGHSFKGLGYDFEHEYVARMAYDNGDEIFGNWSYCVAVMGAVGEFSYVKRFTGPNELINYLSVVGPVGLSVKGNMQGYYNTNGHLLVCKGYKVVNGNYIFICNDPNIRGVEIEYSYETIKNVWRNVGYCIDTEYNVK